MFTWIDKAKKYKTYSTDNNANEKELDYFKNVPLLFIDDLFKTPSSSGVTSADINLALDIVDYRYRNNLVTIFSSEMSIAQIIDISEALGGRIKQKAAEYAININKDRSRNYRLKGKKVDL